MTLSEYKYFIHSVHILNISLIIGCVPNLDYYSRNYQLNRFGYSILSDAFAHLFDREIIQYVYIR